MKLLLIIPTFFPATIYGGPIFSTLNACNSLSKLDDINVQVCTTNANMTTKLQVESNKWLSFNDHFFVKYYNETIIGKFSLSLLFGVWRDIKSADVLHIQSVFCVTIPISFFFASLFKKPVLFSPRGALCSWGLNQGSQFKKLWLNVLIKPFNSILTWHATSEQEKSDILTQFPNAKVVIIPNGINSDTFAKVNILNKPEFCKKFIDQILSPTKIIVSMGRIHKKKGFDILIESFGNILSEHKEAILLIAGNDGGEKSNLDTLIIEKNLSNKVFFVGELLDQNKIDFLANADIFASPSHDENFGNVYLESLAAGTPIVASLNTPWQVVEEANCGKWVANTIEDTAQAMLYLLSQDRETMRLNSKKLATQYEWKNIALQFKNLYQSMLDNEL